MLFAKKLELISCCGVDTAYFVTVLVQSLMSNFNYVFHFVRVDETGELADLRVHVLKSRDRLTQALDRAFFGERGKQQEKDGELSLTEQIKTENQPATDVAIHALSKHSFWRSSNFPL